MNNQTKREEQLPRTVSTEEGIALARKWGCAFFETNPRSKQNVGDAFYELVRTARAYYAAGPAVHATKTKFGIFSKV